MLTIQSVTVDLLDDLARLFGAESMTQKCWCMWFIKPVKDFHADGTESNRADFCELAANSDIPMGLLAYQDGEPVGWCAAGPRARYTRALHTPTYRGGDPQDDESVWLAPCFYIHKDARGLGVGRALLEAAVELARQHGAIAIEGFPYSVAQRHSGGNTNVGFEPLFAACGFEVIRTPSSSRVVMRRELQR